MNELPFRRTMRHRSNARCISTTKQPDQRGHFGDAPNARPTRLDGAGLPASNHASHPIPPDAHSAQWLRVTLSSIGDGVITADKVGRVTLLNPVAQALTGWSPQQAGGQPLEVVFHVINGA